MCVQGRQSGLRGRGPGEMESIWTDKMLRVSQVHRATPGTCPQGGLGTDAGRAGSYGSLGWRQPCEYASRKRTRAGSPARVRAGRALRDGHATSRIIWPRPRPREGCPLTSLIGLGARALVLSFPCSSTLSFQLVVVAAGPLCVPAASHESAAPSLWPSPHDCDSAASDPCLSPRLRSRIGFPSFRGGAAGPLPGWASATRLAVRPRPAPLRVACLPLSVVDSDADLPGSRCRRCRPSANSSPHRAPPPAGRPLAGQPSSEPKTFGSGKEHTVLPSPKEREGILSGLGGECHGSAMDSWPAVGPALSFLDRGTMWARSARP